MAEVPLPTPTQVPVPSTDIRNAVFAGAKLDEEVTGTGEFYTDRLGVKRLTNTGRNNQFDAAQLDRANRFEQFLLSSGYVFLGDYEDGPFQFSARNQYIRYNNQYYRLNAATDVGFTTTGTDATSFANDVTHFVLMDGDTLRQNLGSSELPGASLVSLVYGNVAGLLQGMTYPQAHGARGDGTHDDTDALYAAFKSSAETVHIPRGTYLITRKLKCLLTKNLNVVCAPGVVFKLADGVRDKMFVFVGADNRKYDFSWFGGELDGNWNGQGEETLNSNGTFKDLSRGMVASLFNRVRLENIYVHDFRGHSALLNKSDFG
ncbi:glycosyl hydrolase family 28-related protein [Klebsiella pneumoniae]|uniref:glycosyl hydrolase family 28-related protein n=1 Tax=Klebsiella pneumoniae TaxID=573 RepID=UPI000E2E2A83|nr:glycosyl hydrolase family 28-related protein [Klebsiella pneumoniae]SXJ92073.1 Pectate lyase superfamily protein [Klebsiella pneumoniae]